MLKPVQFNLKMPACSIDFSAIDPYWQLPVDHMYRIPNFNLGNANFFRTNCCIPTVEAKQSIRLIFFC